MPDPYIALKNVTVNDGWIEGDIVVQSNTLNINNTWHFKTLNNEPVELSFGEAKFVGKAEIRNPNMVCLIGNVKLSIISLPVEHCEAI